MMSRMRYFVFEHFFDPHTCPEIKPCALCFALWLSAARGRPRGPPGPPSPKLNAYFASQRGGQDRSSEPGWFVQKPAGTYQANDHVGCFRCGDPGHMVRDCPLQFDNSGSSSSTASTNSFCGRCGAARQHPADIFCKSCGQRF